ncbi:MAG: hypothetical protein AB7S26_40430 [Sandaracinaceae bacterium]
MNLSRATCALALGLALSIGALSSPAYADDPVPEVSDGAPDAEPRDVWGSLLQLSATVGLDTPFGVAGGAIEFTPWRYLAIYAGGGIGRAGGQASGGIRFQFPVGNGAVGLMTGVGGGAQDWDNNVSGGVVTRHWDFAFNLHMGVTFEYRWEMGLFGRLAFGATGILESQPESCTMTVDDNTPAACNFSSDILAAPIWGWAGLTVGYALDL